MRHAQMQRLVYLERVAYWTGRVSRLDLMEAYGISGVQASTDFGAYQDRNPGALRYDLSVKRYFWADGARPVLCVPDFSGALREFVPQLLRRPPRIRQPLPAVQRAVLRAAMSGAALSVAYRPDSAATGRREGKAVTLEVVIRELWQDSNGRWMANLSETGSGQAREIALADITHIR